MTLVDYATFAVLAVIAVRLVSGARVALSPRGRSRVADLVRELRPRHFLLAPVVFVAVVTAVIALFEVPGMDLGWWTALGGIGNPVTGGTERTTGTALEWILPLVFLVLLLPALPLFAEAEERIFRRGSERRSFWGRTAWGVLFGVVHVVIGIPIGAALALSIGGWYFTAMYLWGYRRSGGDPAAALAESTAAHVAYNLEILALVILLLLLGV